MLWPDIRLDSQTLNLIDESGELSQLPDSSDDMFKCMDEREDLTQALMKTVILCRLQYFMFHLDFSLFLFHTPSSLEIIMTYFFYIFYKQVTCNITLVLHVLSNQILSYVSLYMHVYVVNIISCYFVCHQGSTTVDSTLPSVQPVSINLDKISSDFKISFATPPPRARERPC